MNNLTQVKKMPPIETITFYLSRLKCLHHNQLCEAMRLHGKGEIDQFKREQVLKLSSAQRIFLRSSYSADYYCINAASAVPNNMVGKAFWIVLSYLRSNVRIEVMGINEFNGIDFVDVYTHSIIRIVPVPEGNITAVMRARATHQEGISYIFMIDIPSQKDQIRPITESDSAAIVSNQRGGRIWDVRYITFGTAREEDEYRS